MTTQEVKWRLNAILSAGVKGYSCLMGYNAGDPFEINCGIRKNMIRQEDGVERQVDRLRKDGRHLD
jgi:hypothetical protein